MKTLIKLLVIASFIFSQDDYYEFIITPEEPEFGLGVGSKLSINNNEMVFYANDFQNSTQVSRFYKIIEDEWFLQQEITSNDNIKFHHLDDDLFIRSEEEMLANQSTPDYIINFYEKVNQLWQYTGINISNPDVLNYKYFGSSFYRNGSLLITYSQHIASSLIKIHIFRKVDNNWIEEFSILPEAVGGDLYINNSMFIYGVSGYNIGEYSNVGAIQIYTWNGITWQEDTLISSPELANELRFGRCIRYSNNQLFISSTNENNDSGAIYVYNKIDGVWVYNQKIIPSDVALGDQFGRDIEVNDNYLITNSWKDDDAGPSTGGVYMFQKNDVGMWVEVRKIVSSDAEAIDLFGSNFAFNSNHIVVGAPMKNNMSGSVYVYELEDFSLYSNFATYPVTGNAPLTLTFNDLSQGEPAAWQWDFDSDGTIDSEQQYPEHTYEFSGDYTVTLTVTNNQESSTFTKENYVSVSGGLAYGDLNDDATVNIIDILIMVEIIMEEIIPTNTQIEAGDMNNSGIIDIIDIVLVVNQILEIN